MWKSDHLKLRCADGNRGQILMIGQRDSARKLMIPGSRGKWTEWMRRRDTIPPGWMLMLLQRGRGKWDSGCARVELCQNCPLFYPQTTMFFGNMCSGVANTFSHQLQSEEHFIVWLHWFVLSARGKKVWKDGDMSHSHISKSYILWNNTSTGWTFGTKTNCMEGLHIRAVAHWIG